MGLYINPEDRTKAQWLATNGRKVNEAAIDTHAAYSAIRGAQEVPVVLLDNGIFDAAGVAFSYDEFLAFTGKDDRRRRQVWIVPVSAVMAVCGDDAKQPYFGLVA